MNKLIIGIIGFIFVFPALFSTIGVAQENTSENETLIEKGKGLGETLISNSENLIGEITDIAGISPTLFAALLMFVIMIVLAGPKFQKIIFYIVIILLVMYAIGVFE